MKLRILLVIAVIFVIGVVCARRVKAAPQENVPFPCVVNVPSQWGKFMGTSQYGLAFEDQSGTIRLIDQMPCSIDSRTTTLPNVIVEVRRK